MISADLDQNGNALRFVNDDVGTYLELAGCGRVRCSPYHLYRVLQGSTWDQPYSSLMVERENDEVLVHVEGRTVSVPCDRYECALRKAFGIGGA